MTCKWDRETEAYLTDGEPCRIDDYGDPTYHCTARRTCSVHIGRDDLTCPRCIGRTRADIRWVVNLAALMPTEALNRGVESEPANLAGPAGDPLVLTWRRIDHARVSGGPIGDGTEAVDPTEVLGTWQAMLSEDYDHELPDRITLSTAAAYLDRNLPRIANDDRQDFPLMAREIRKCRGHLESVLRNSSTPERGAPCPACHERGVEKPPRLARKYGHWCEDRDCERVHHGDDTDDVWQCPRDRGHEWSEHDYRLRVADWHEETKTA